MMKSLYVVDILLCSILIVTIVGYSEAELEQTKNRRAGGTSGLYAFPRVGRSDPTLMNGNSFNSASSLYAYPRVGRSDPSLSNANGHNSEAENAAAAAAAAFDVLYPATFDEYDDYSKSDVKRANLIAFPRVGRTDSEMRNIARFLALQQALDKRAGPSATTGVWFGPRLGKRSVDNQKHDSAQGQKEDY